MNIRFILITALIFTISISCKKAKEKINEDKDCEFTDQICDTALFHLGNKTNVIIYFGLGTNMLEDSLAPGEVRTVKMDHVNVTYDKKTCERKRESWSSWYVHTEYGDWAFNVDHCQKVSNFDYSADSLIYLYDDTSY